MYLFTILLFFNTAFCSGELLEQYCLNDYDCSLNAVCERYNMTSGICTCKPDYATFNSNIPCNYKRIGCTTYLLLDIFLGYLFPIGQVAASEFNLETYSGKLALAQIFTCGITGFIIFWCFTSLFRKYAPFSEAGENSNCACFGACITSTWLILFILSCMGWYIVNIITSALKHTTDKHGIECTFY